MFRAMYFLKIVVLTPTFAVLTLISRAHTPVHLIIPTVCLYICVQKLRNFEHKITPNFHPSSQRQKESDLKLKDEIPFL